jgi:hypothetical protein
MGKTDQLRELPDGWRWVGPAAQYLEWLDPDDFLMFPFPINAVLPAGSEDSTWVLHSQFVCPPGLDPGGFSNSHGGFGFTPRPPEEWHRVLWKDVAAAKGVELRGPMSDGREVPPCFRWDAMLSWQDSPLFNAGEDTVAYPSEGSLGQLELQHLVPLLMTHATTSKMLGVPSYADPTGRVFDSGQDEGRYAFTFELPSMLDALLNHSKPNERFTPELWWPEDRSWLVWSDWDLLGTKIFGSHALIQQIREHQDIESLDWFPKAAH